MATPSPIGSASPIRSWTDGYAALRRRAGEMRGWIELETEAPDRRWPRTTGLDVIVIASFIDQAFQRTDQVTFAGTALRWQSCKDDLELDALPAINDTYRGNRDFWTCLAMMCSHLSWVGCPLPPQAAWSVLLAHLSPRNASATQDRPPVWFAAAAAESLDKLFMAQLKYLEKLHGSDRLDPEPDMRGGPMPVPRSTNGEVIQLAEFWSKALNEPKLKDVNQYETLVAQWNAVQHDIETYARKADPNAVYLKNHAFWRTAMKLSILTASAIKWGMSDRERWMASVAERAQAVATQAKVVAHAIAEGVRETAAEAAQGAGKVVNSAARGLLGGIGTPLLIGGGIVAGFFLLRSRREPAPAHRET
jgi:hypothetical protein